MERFISVIRNNTAFLLPVALFWVFGLLALLLWGQVPIQLCLNTAHSDIQDNFWLAVTAMGGTVFYICVFLAGSLFSYRYLVSAALSIGLAMGVTTLLKYAIDMPRPVELLDTLGLLHQADFVGGYELRRGWSFPSGHTTTAFCLFCTLALFVRRNWLKAFWFVAALSVAYSRIYLMQHFLSDVVAGSFIGTVSAVIVYAYVKDARWINFGRPLVSARRYGIGKK